jgi:hypothetical protein
MAEPEQKVITVSRDALRADLSDLELRLREYLDTRLELKANAHDLFLLTERVDAVDRGELTAGAELKIKSLIDQAFSTRLTSGWAMRGNKATVLAFCVAICSLGVAIASLLFGG